MHPRETIDRVRPQPFRGGWPRTMFLGVVAAGAAALAVHWPGIMLNALAVGACAYLCAEGFMTIAIGVRAPTLRTSLWLRGALALLVGVAAAAVLAFVHF